jgi:putative transposase
MERIPASERTRERLKALISGEQEAADSRSELVRLAARLIIEEALEGEASDALGRGYYARGGVSGRGYRNGYRTGRLKSAEGLIDYSAPQIAERTEPFRSRIRGILRGRTEELEDLAVEMYARGLSTRDIEALFADESGNSLLSRTAVSEITERLWAEYEAFASRDLSEFDILYLFVDGIAERLHLGQPREAVLAAWGITADGKKVLLHLAPGTKEDTASCREFFQDMRRRGLPDPLLVVSDGAPGAIRAIEECFPRALRQRCLAHKMRNLQSKVPETSGRNFMPARRPATRLPRQRWRGSCVRTSSRLTAAICRRWWPASTTTSRLASRIFASPWRIDASSAPPTCSNGCLVRNGGAPRSFHMPSASELF